MCNKNMDEREELKKELKAELQWVKYRLRMLDIIEKKLLKKIIDMAGSTKNRDLSGNEIKVIK